MYKTALNRVRKIHGITRSNFWQASNVTSQSVKREKYFAIIDKQNAVWIKEKEIFADFDSLEIVQG